MKKLFLLLLFLILSVSLFAAFPKDAVSVGVSVLGAEGMEEDKSSFAIGGYCENQVLFGEMKTVNIAVTTRTDVGYVVDESEFGGININFFSGAGALFKPIGGLEIETVAGLGLFSSISNNPIFDVTAGLQASIGYAFGQEDSIVVRLGANATYGFLFNCIYYVGYLGAGVRF